MTTPILDVQKLQKMYGSTKILDDISFSIPVGQSVAIIGPSGGGKSTLLRCVSSLESFSHGDVEYEGVTIARGGVVTTPSPLGLRIGLVFQELFLWPNKTVLWNVAEAPHSVLKQSRRQATEIARDWLDRLGIADFEHNYPHELSGGQKQRVAIARCLALNPRLILMDEITSALDVQTAARTLELLASLRDGKRSFVFITHHLNFAQQYTDKTIVLIKGQIAEEGPSTEIVQSPSSDATRQFLSVIHETA